MHCDRTWLIRAVLGVYLFCCSTFPALAEKRVALVIGNATYATAPKLKNPRHDAEDMTAALERLNFKVIAGYDLDDRGMGQKAREFAREVAGADVALFFFAGHGLQVNGLNYLAPTNVALKSEADLDFETLPLDLVLRQMRLAKISLVFLDACRDNPLARGLRAATRSGMGSVGLARIEDATGMMISYATQPGNIALDGDGRNSPYSKALLANIGKPGLSVSDTMIEVRKQVLAETGDKQVPWENSSLTGKFFFVPESGTQVVAALPPPVAAKPMTASADQAMETAFWASVANTNDPALYREYLRRFPGGTFAAIAQAQIAALNKPRSTEPPVLPPLPPPLVSPPILSPKAMAEELQKEMRRVGCFADSPDGVWGANSMRAMATYNAQAQTALPIDSPSREAISTLKAQTKTVCAVEAAALPPAAKPSRKKVFEKDDNDEKPQPKQKKSSSPSSSPSKTNERTSGGDQKKKATKESSGDSAGTIGAVVVGGILGGIIGGSIAKKRK
jgi:Caspase domain